jgi:hypothetical protein
MPRLAGMESWRKSNGIGLWVSDVESMPALFDFIITSSRFKRDHF